jgi:hypothetical protein
MSAKKPVKAKRKSQRRRPRTAAKAKTKARRAAAKKPAELHEASATTRASVLRGFRQVLKEHGISGDIAAVQLDAPATRGLAPGPGCPPNTIRRLVAVRLPNGTLRVTPECVPVDIV